MKRMEDAIATGAILFVGFLLLRSIFQPPARRTIVVPPDDPRGMENRQSVEILARATPSDYETMRDAFRQAWANGPGGDIDPRTLAALLAQSALETGHWKSMYHWNAGNITTSSRAFFRLKERGEFTPHKYAVYSSPLEGAGALISLLGRRYPLALAAMLDGNMERAAHELKRAGYYEAPEAAYAKGLRQLYDQYLQRVLVVT